MSITNNIVSTPIKVSEMADFFGVEDNVRAVCKCVDINKWSKYKPIHTRGVLMAARTATSPMTQNGSYYWWQGELGDCDFKRQETSALGTIISLASQPWEQRTDADFGDPENFPSRLGDFTGYSHDALPPIVGKIDTEVHYLLETGSTTFTAMMPQDTKGGFSFADFNLGSCYAAVCWTDEGANGKVSYIRTSNNPISGGTFNVSLGGSDFLKKKEYTVYGILAQNVEKYTASGGSKVSNYYYNLPLVVSKKIRVCTSEKLYGVSVLFVGSVDSGGTLTYNVRATHTGFSDQECTVTLVSLQVYNKKDSTSSPRMNLLRTGMGTEVTVSNASGPKTFAANDLSVVLSTSYTTPWVRIVYRTDYEGTVEKWQAVMRPNG